MKAFVIMFNRLTWPKALCERLSDEGCEVILIDNGSVYPPLLEWYKKCSYKVHVLPDHYGHKSLWQSNIISQYKDQYYIVTDHDLDLSLVPEGFVDFLMKGLENDVVKSGLSLKIDDLPDNPYANKVYEYEKRFWHEMRDKNGFYFSEIDTTLAVYDRDRVKAFETDRFFRAVRAPKPYEARHLPWYNEPGKISEEEQFYIDNIKRVAFWTMRYKETWS
jgi:hypothetical protein